MPQWLQITSMIANFCVALALGITTAYIAGQQWKTNKRKLKLDLFDRRFKIYNSILEFVYRSDQGYIFSEEQFDRILKHVNPARFLFRPITGKYIQRLEAAVRKSQKLVLDQKVNAIEGTEQEENLKDKFEKLNTEIENVTEKLERIMSSYLDLHDA